MQTKIFSLILLSLIFSASVAQDIKYPGLKGFKIKTDYPVYTPENLWDFINGAADTYLSYDFADLHVAEYKKGKNVIKLEIYRHSDNTMAFGIYSSERSPSFKYINLGSQGYVADGAINFFKGNYYVKLKTYSKKEKILKANESLATKVAAMLPGDDKMPGMLGRFPSEGKKVNEETFINESVLGHSFLKKAYKIPYQVGNDSFSVFYIECPSQEEAKKTAATYIASTGIDPVETADSRFVLSDGYNGSVFLSWKENKIVIISGLAKDQAALADRYTTEILK